MVATSPSAAGARLLLGPVLRHVGETNATMWVQTSRPAQVEVLGCRASTFTVGEQHYALVEVSDPVFGNAVAALTFSDRSAELVFERSGPSGQLEPVPRIELAGLSTTGSNSKVGESDRR